MKRSRLVLAIASVVLSVTAILGQGGQAEPKIIFKHPSDAPPPPSGGLSREAEYPPTAAGESRERGSFANVVARRISAVTVTWFDPSRFKTEAQAEDLLRQLLNSGNTTTFAFHAWSYGFDSPGIVATVEHVSGQHGRLIVWCPPINLTWAYQDEKGNWWWSMWDSLKAPLPQSVGVGAAPK